MIFRELRRAHSPRRGFRTALWRRIESEFQPPIAARLPFLLRAGVPALVLAMIFAGTGAYTYASPEVTPEHPFYGLRRGIERVEESLALTGKAKAEARMRRLAHRLAEAERLVKKDGGFEAVLSEVDQELSTASITEPRVFKAEKVRRIMEATDDRTLEHLETIVSQNPVRALPGVQKLIIEDARRLEDRLNKVADEKTRRFLQSRLERRRQALESVIARLESLEENGVATSTPAKAKRLDRAIDKLRLELERISALTGTLESRQE